MSTRKPKAIVIRDEEPSDTEEPSKAESKLAKGMKRAHISSLGQYTNIETLDKKSAFTTKRKIKIQPPAQNEVCKSLVLLQKHTNNPYRMI
jgi:hypothetical protein